MTFLTATMLRDAAISFPMLGDWSIDPPYSFTVFGFEIYFYGAIIALGFILAALFCAKQAAKFGLTSDDLFDFVIWLIPTCIIGARLYYVLFKLDYFLANPSEIPILARRWPRYLRRYNRRRYNRCSRVQKEEDTRSRARRSYCVRSAHRTGHRPLGQLYKPRGLRR